MYYLLKNIAKIVSGTVHGSGNTEGAVHQLLIDSRTVSLPEVSLFFALKSDRNDGHKYISDVYKKRVCNFVVSQLPADISNYPGCNFILVKDTLVALQLVAANHRKKFNIPVIGITGSYGKTIVKEWLYYLLHEDKNVVRSPKSYNSQVGVPLSVWQIHEQNDMAVFEAGISKRGEMEKLEKIISPGIGLITNIGPTHDENFSNSKEKINEKLKLFKHSSILIYCRDYTELHEAISTHPDSSGKTLFTWSRKSKASLQVAKITIAGNEAEIQGIYKNNFLKIRIPFTDEASIENAIHCWCVLLFLGYSSEVIEDRMLRLIPIEMRLELKEGVNGCSIINDSYNSDLESLSIALDFLNQFSSRTNPLLHTHTKQSKKTLIFSDIFHSRKNGNDLYQEVADLLKEKGINRIIGIGESISKYANLFDIEKSFYLSTDEFLAQYNANLFSNETILLKGARVYGFERISHVLQQKAHETVLEINLNALVHNLNYYRSKLVPETKIMAMVKAFSYGSGGFEIANVLQYHHVDYLAVAYADEGIELRKEGITLPIMVMNPEEPSYDMMIKHDLEPEIFSFRVLKLFEDAVKRYGRKDAPYPIHLKFDTGMHRLGFEEKDINELVVRIKNFKSLEIRSVFSHLAASDEIPHDEFTLAQIKKFKYMSEIVSSQFDYPIIKHILNSAGILRFPGAQFDMVRLGIGLYGIAANEAEQLQLKNVSTLKTTISQIKNIPVGDSVGYSRRFVAKNDMIIATVPIGYADGLNRRFGNGNGKMIINGEQAPIIGSVCMDMCMLDISRIKCKEGDPVLVFGEQHPISLLAKYVDTIPYELFTGISRRVKRVYFHE